MFCPVDEKSFENREDRSLSDSEFSKVARVTPKNPYEPPTTDAKHPHARKVVFLYWNAILASIALCMHCIPFAAYEFIDDEGATGSTLFPLAPLALIMMMVCIPAVVVQAVLLLVAFGKRSPVRYHRMTAFAITCTAIALISVAGRFGWFIRV